MTLLTVRLNYLLFLSNFAVQNMNFIVLYEQVYV